MKKAIESILYGRGYKIANAVFGIYLYFWLLFTKYVPTGDQIFEEDWDVLIILDACRVDALREVASEYEFIRQVDETWSVGSTSKEWYINNFTKKFSNDISKTTLITANGWADNELKNESDISDWTVSDWVPSNRWLCRLIERDLVSPDEFNEYISTLSLDSELPDVSTTLPDELTSIGISKKRSDNPERLILHYVQPHAPYLSRAVDRGECLEIEKEPFDALKDGKNQEVWDLYLDNLRFALDSVETLLNNIDADNVIITADHGEMMGEYGLYGHMGGLPFAPVRKVPLVRTTATNRENGEFEVPEGVGKSTEGQLSDFLQDMGYL